MKLFGQAILKFMLGFLLVCVLLFVPAGSLEYWNGWLLIALLFIPMFIAGLVLLWKNPKLLESRLKAKETEKDQKEVIAASGIMFLLSFVLAGLNYRYNWHTMSLIVTIIGSIIFLISYLLYAEVLRENTYLSRTIEVQKDQKVIDTGLYGIVRHPMYFATLFLFLSMPFILGSIFSFIVMLIYPIIIIKRIKNEEKVLEKDLKGYKEYKQKVKYKILPFLY